MVVSLLMLTRLAGFVGATLLALPAFTRPLTMDDYYRWQSVSDPRISPDGLWVAYTVTTSRREGDKQDQDIWLVSWKGQGSLQLTSSSYGEHGARWSPDGKSIAFLSDRPGDQQGENAGDQIWLLNRAGGEPRRLSHFGEEISSFAWSPDGTRMVFTAQVVPPEQKGSDPPLPIVIDRLQFKSDDAGYLRGERTHLFLLDVASGETTQLTNGPFDELQPAWSPDGSRIAFISKRGDDPDAHSNWDLYVVDATPGATPRQLTTNPGTDGDPTEDWSSRPPIFSPDGKHIAHLASGKPEDLWYSLIQVATTPSTDRGKDARLPLAKLDRNTLDPSWSTDSKWIFFRLEDDLSVVLARVRLKDGRVERLTPDDAVVSEFDLGAGRRARGKLVAVRSTVNEPAELFAVEGKKLRQLTHHNDAWLQDVEMAEARTIQFKSADDLTIRGLMLLPPGGTGGRRPTILRLHGGPVAQHQNEFDFEWQMLAANGYVIVAPNPRGSSGRGYEFQKKLFAQWGMVDVPDILAAADYAVSVGIADPDRLGVGGWSYGAILTNYVIASDTRFKAATSGAGMGNMLAGYGDDQYVREWELELGLPWEHSERWLQVSAPFLHADRITTPTLFLVGAEDHNVPPIGAEQMYQALRRLKVPTQLVIYPDENHSISRPSFAVDRVQRYLEWYGRYLKSN